jgi:hypothetical protein
MQKTFETTIWRGKHAGQIGVRLGRRHIDNLVVALTRRWQKRSSSSRHGGKQTCGTESWHFANAASFRFADFD